MRLTRRVPFGVERGFGGDARGRQAIAGLAYGGKANISKGLRTGQTAQGGSIVAGTAVVLK